MLYLVLMGDSRVNSWGSSGAHTDSFEVREHQREITTDCFVSVELNQLIATVTCVISD